MAENTIVEQDSFLDSKNKTEFYRACSLKLKQITEVKLQKVIILQSKVDKGEYVDELDKLELMDKYLDEEFKVLEIESKIAQKDKYCSIFAEQTRLGQIETERISKECDLYQNAYMKQANDLIADPNIKETDKAELHGYLAQIHAGVKTIISKAHLYGQLKDKVLKLQIR